MPAVATHRNLGLTVSIAEILDPDLWRAGYAFNLVLGEGTRPVEDTLIAAAGAGCVPRVRAETMRGIEIETAVDETCTAAAELDDTTIRMHLRAAASEMEICLQVPLGTVVCKSTPIDDGLVRGNHYDREVPRLPYRTSDVANYYQINLPPGVISVERVRAFWFGQVVWTISGGSAAISLEHPGTASLHLMPLTGALFALWPLTGTPIYSLMQHLISSPTPLPSVWAVDYTLGPVTGTGVPGHIEAVFAHWIRMKAALTLLPLAGAGRTKGIAGVSLGMDGLSESIQLAGGGSRSIWVALEDAYQRALDSIDLGKLAVYKRGLVVRGMGH